MQPRSLEQRVVMLEQQMQQLKDLPERVERVESQILQLRTEMKDGFSAIRGEMGELRRELREDIRIDVEESQNLTKGLHAEAIGTAKGLHAQAMDAMKGLRAEIASVDAALRRDVVSRLDRLLELQRPRDNPA